MRLFGIILFSTVALFAEAQRTIVINSIPANTPDSDQIFFAGDPNGWDPGNTDWTFLETDGEWVLDLPESAASSFEGKITRGSWNTVEGNANGGYLPNRNFSFTESDTVYIEVLSWEGEFVPDDLPENLVTFDEDFYMPELDRSRRIRVLLPSNYDETTLDYPVLYMQDGQNLFSDQESFAGEWEIDEAMLSFEDDGYNGAILVAIDNGGSLRIDEYTPYPHPEYGGGDGEAYADFIVNTLKPAIDLEYRTLPEREYTGIMGSSLGGLISFYAGLKYQDVFSKVGVFSPSFWFNDSIYDFAEEMGKQANMKFYFVAGGQESGSLESDVEEMIALMEAEEFQDEEINFQFVPNGQHSEWFWAQEYPDAFDWLYLFNPLSSGSIPGEEIELYPNPSGDYIYISGMGHSFLFSIYNANGRELYSGSSSIGKIDVGNLPAGMYLFNAFSGQRAISNKFIKL
ncbi:MAG TPA: alpha/beta hydrolase-fold protein [Cryomorphaceae bacterium]|nr:alpha/beta hydrolase-fold protein [Cryomorphaceae bacterium]